MGVSLASRAEYLVSKVKEMKQAQKEIMTYCTGECHTCPIEKMCDWDYNLDLTSFGIEETKLWADFIEKADKHDEEENARQFKEATGYDPMEWNMLTRGLD